MPFKILWIEHQSTRSALVVCLHNSKIFLTFRKDKEQLIDRVVSGINCDSD